MDGAGWERVSYEETEEAWRECHVSGGGGSCGGVG